MHQEMVNDVLRLRQIEFSKAKLPRYDYADQTKISLERVNLATACAIYYGLSTGMVIQYLKGEYIGESRDANEILKKYHHTSVRSIVSISSESSIKGARHTSILRKIMIINTWASKKGISKPFSSSQRSP